MSLLEVRDLRTHFFTRWGIVKAVDGVSFSVEEGQSLGIVGESGCGKSMTALSILRLIPSPGRIVGGEVLLNGRNLLTLGPAEMRSVRGKHVSMILQDPMTSLNPVFTVGNQVGEPLAIHQRLRAGKLRAAVLRLLRAVRIPAPESRIGSYPHQLSGGMRQRSVGAIAIACEPRLLIADEPTTSLDVTIQAQYLELLRDMRQRLELTMVFITHDFGIVAAACDRVAVMYAGRMVEGADVATLFDRPAHPYTQALLTCVPSVENRSGRLLEIPGQPPALHSLPSGCHFAPRCPYAQERCHQEYPPVVQLEVSHTAACWRAQEVQSARQEVSLEPGGQHGHDGWDR